MTLIDRGSVCTCLLAALQNVGKYCYDKSIKCNRVFLLSYFCRDYVYFVKVTLCLFFLEDPAGMDMSGLRLADRGEWSL